MIQVAYTPLGGRIRGCQSWSCLAPLVSPDDALWLILSIGLYYPTIWFDLRDVPGSTFPLRRLRDRLVH